MAAKPEKTIVTAPVVKPIFFTCKFCGETNPLQDLVVIRRFYPQLSACKECARSKPVVDVEETPAENSQE
jgi:hypothetical protein